MLAIRPSMHTRMSDLALDSLDQICVWTRQQVFELYCAVIVVLAQMRAWSMARFDRCRCNCIAANLLDHHSLEPPRAQQLMSTLSSAVEQAEEGNGQCQRCQDSCLEQDTSVCAALCKLVPASCPTVAS